MKRIRLIATLAAAGLATSVLAVPPPPSISSVTILENGTAEQGQTLLRIGYSFPETGPWDCRNVVIDIGGLTSVDRRVGYGDPSASGTTDQLVGMYCNFPKGTYTITVTPKSGCVILGTPPPVVGAPLTASITLASPKVLSASVEIGPSGQGTLTVGADFSHTHNREERYIEFHFNGAQLFGTPWEGPTVGTQTYSFNAGCLPPGTYPAKVVARRCYQQQPRTEPWIDELITSAESTAIEPSITFTADGKGFDPAAQRVRRKGIVDWDLGSGPSNWTVRVDSKPWKTADGQQIGESLVWQPPALTKTGHGEFFFDAPADGQQFVLRALAQSCAGIDTKEVSVPCDPCENATDDPVFLTDGNVRVTDSDPLPLIAGLVLTRTYNSDEQVTALFGRGWTTLFDRRLIVSPDLGELVLSLVSETNQLETFRGSSGSYRQTWPQSRAVTSQLRDGSVAGTYVYRAAGSAEEAVYRASDGRLIELRDLRTQHAATIEYDGAGRPQSMTDSWSGVAWNLTMDATKRVVTSIAVSSRPDLVWTYNYDAFGNLTSVLAPGSAAWRTYEYSANRLTVSRDPLGNLIESHTYDSGGYGITSTGPSDEIASIQYNIATADPDERITRVTANNGNVTDYVLRPSGGSWRTVRVINGCGSCGARELSVVRDARGRVVRRQHADGYVTAYSFGSERLLSTQSAMKPVGCDPETSSTRCMLDPAALATAALEATAATLTTSYEYADPNWPDRVTAVTTPSIRVAGQTRREETQYHPETGEATGRTMVAWATGVSGPVAVSRTTVTRLYGEAQTSLSPAFAPGGTFTTAWLALPQPALLRKSVDGPRSDVEDITSFVYYPIDASVPGHLRGQLAATRNASGHITRFEDYDVFGNVTRAVDPNGVVTEMTYDILGRIATTTTRGVAGCDTTADPLCANDLTSTRSYSPPAGPLQREQRAGGGVTTYTYDPRGRVATVSRGPSTTDLRERIEYTYDPGTGQKSTERILAFADGVWVEKKRETYAYDLLRQLQSVTHADTTSVAYTDDRDGRVATIRDENHSSPNTSYSYDPAGRLVKVEQTLSTAPGGAIATRYAYDRHGNLTGVTDPNGNVTSYIYDDFGQMISQASPVTGTTGYTYDASGNVTSTQDANGAVTERTYDASNRVLTATSTRAADNEVVTWSYDNAASGRFALGRLSAMSDPSGATTYSYDRRGLLREEAKTIESTTYMTRFQYDANGNRSLLKLPSGRVVQYTFDFAGRPQSASTGATSLVTSAVYLPFGPPTELVFGNGTTRRMQYDARYRMTRNELTGPAGIIAAYDYDLDPAGNITSLEDATDAAYNRSFGYDDLNRLTTANTGSALWGNGSYAYDRMGNLTSSALGTWQSAFVYAGTTPKLSTAVAGGVSTTMQYDPAGNELTAGSNLSIYSPRNHLLNAGADTYTYDGRGIRTITRSAGLVRVLSVSVTPGVIAGGESATGTVTLSAPAPAEGVTVALSSANASLTVPASVVVPAGAATATFVIQTSAVTASVTIDVTATLTVRVFTTATLVQSCMLHSVAVAPTAVTGGGPVTGTVHLLNPAGSEGASVALSSNHSAVTVPASVQVPPGATSASFPIATAPSHTVDVTITAQLCGFRSTQLTVLAPTIAEVSVAPASVASGTTAIATVDLTGAAPAPGTVVTATSSDTTVATVPASVTVPAGETTTTFAVDTIARDTATSVLISAADGTTVRSAPLSVGPCTPAAPAPDFADGEVVWFDDAIPAGAIPYGTWQWDSAQKASGTMASVDPAIADGHSHWFENATTPLVPGAGDKLFVYVLVDPCNPPREIMIGWGDGSWEHRAYWGEDLFPYGNPPGIGRIRFGDIPAAGEWVRLEVPAQTFGLEGHSIHGLALSVWGGRAWFDRAGRRSCDSGVPTPPSSFPASEIVWFDDSVPPGVTLYGDWAWDTTQHASGTQSHVQPPATGAADHWFENASNPITVGPGDTLFVYAYADPCNPPREIMLSWGVNGDWEHRAYWGEDLLPYATPGVGRFYMGWLPRGGGWIKLEVPATLLKLAGKTITGMAFSNYGGRVWFDRVGKTSCVMPPPAAPSLGGDEVVWFDDAPPAGAPLSGTWQWDTSQKASGTQAMADPAGAAGREFWFEGTTAPMTTGANDNLFVYVLVDPCEPPREIMVGWYDGSWEHRAYWGENIFPYGAPGTGRFSFGPVPEGGQWVRLEIPAAMMNLANKSITGMAFSVYGGRAWFDRSGKRSCTAPIAAAPSLNALEVVWFDDATPPGAVLRGTWNWDATQKASGTVSNTAPAAPEIEERWFDGATTTLSVNAGDNLFVYALIDPCDPPREIMVGWHDGSWEHRAYWGENLLPYGTPPTGRFAMGVIPQAGEWVRLEIPAAIANLAGKTISGISLSVVGGKVWFDRAGKYACSAPAAPLPTTAPGERLWFDDELPDGVISHGIWDWDTTQKASGTRSHTGPAMLEVDEHWFERATETLTIGPDEELFTYVLVDPCDPPREIMLSVSDGMWEHRGYWGENLLPYATPGVGRFRVGDLPVPGQWTKLILPSEKFNLAGRTINGMGFSAWGGKVWFDRVGVQPQSSAALASDLPSPMTSASSRPDTTPLTTTTRRYSLYTPELNLLAETELTSTTTPAIAHEYVWFGGQPVAEIDASTNAIAYYFNDHLGTPILQTEATATVTWRAEYDPYGTIHSYRAGASRHQPLRFPGQENEEGSELSYNIFRWYRSGWGRYTQADPIGLERGDNLYQYALSNPIRVFDSAGLAAELLCREVSAAAGSNWFQKTVINLYKPLHCRLRVTCKCDTSTGSGFDKTVGRENVNPKGSPGIYDTTIDNYSSTAYPSPPWSSTPIGTPSGSDCQFEKCALKAFAAQDANPGLVPPYNGLGPNSNTYVNELIKQCGGKTNFPKKAKGYDYYD